MSADNGVYIAEFNDGFRVAHAQAIENCYEDGALGKAYRGLDFADSEVFESRDSALLKADEIAQDILNDIFGVLEYGIAFIGKYNEEIMPKEEAISFLKAYWGD